MRCVVLDKIGCFFPRDALDMRHFVPELYPVEFIRVMKQFRSAKQTNVNFPFRFVKNNLFSIYVHIYEAQKKRTSLTRPPTIALPECCGDELSVWTELVDHICHRFSVLCVQCLIDFVEQIKRRGIALLNRKYQRQCHERFLPARQLVHLSHFGSVSRERHSYT